MIKRTKVKNAKLNYHVEYDVNPDTRDFLSERINEFNFNALKDKAKTLSIILKSGSGDIVAGLGAAVWSKHTYVAVLWVDESLRGQGYGTALMKRVESEAKQQGCDHIIVDTYTFQAVDFYRNLGYQEMGTIKNVLGGHDRIYFKKNI